MMAVMKIDKMVIFCLLPEYYSASSSAMKYCIIIQPLDLHHSNLAGDFAFL